MPKKNQESTIPKNPVTPKQQLLALLDDSLKAQKRLAAVEVCIPVCPVPEIIIIPTANMSVKAAYYAEAYSEQLHLKNNQSIRITRFAAADTPDKLFAKLGVEF